MLSKLLILAVFMQVNQLRKTCAACGLDRTGKKAELVARLKEFQLSQPRPRPQQRKASGQLRVILGLFSVAGEGHSTTNLRKRQALAADLTRAGDGDKLWDVILPLRLSPARLENLTAKDVIGHCDLSKSVHLDWANRMITSDHPLAPGPLVEVKRAFDYVYVLI